MGRGRGQGVRAGTQENRRKIMCRQGKERVRHVACPSGKKSHKTRKEPESKPHPGFKSRNGPNEDCAIGLSEKCADAETGAGELGQRCGFRGRGKGPRNQGVGGARTSNTEG